MISKELMSSASSASPSPSASYRSLSARQISKRSSYQMGYNHVAARYMSNSSVPKTNAKWMSEYLNLLQRATSCKPKEIEALNLRFEDKKWTE